MFALALIDHALLTGATVSIFDRFEDAEKAPAGVRT
jgi:hypothetical protein